jgi:hypothetical protein
MRKAEKKHSAESVVHSAESVVHSAESVVHRVLRRNDAISDLGLSKWLIKLIG